MTRLASLLAGGAALLLAGACLAEAPQVVDLPTRPGVRQRMLVLQPERPTAVLVLLAGGNGHLGIFDNASLRNDRNFLVRSRELFVQRGNAVVLLDAPSDRAQPPYLRGSFRESAEHAADIGFAIRWAHERFGLPVWLVGTSRGTQSAASAAALLSGPAAPDGLVLSSTILASGRADRLEGHPVQEMALEQLRLPVLVTHHEQDQCPVCPPALLPALMARLDPARSRLISYRGGRPVGAACEALAFHGYHGIEEQVVADISAWIAAPPK